MESESSVLAKLVCDQGDAFSWDVHNIFDYYPPSQDVLLDPSVAVEHPDQLIEKMPRSSLLVDLK